jgi:hypothetical protein
VALAPVVVNQLAARPPEAAFGGDVAGLLAGAGVDGDEAAAIGEAAEALAGRWARQQGQMRGLAERLPLHQLGLPARPHAALGPADLAVLADALGAHIEDLPVGA